MTLLLDTNVVSALRRPSRADPTFRAWGEKVVLTPSAAAISVVTLTEIQKGILRAEARSRPEANILRVWFDTEILPRYRDASLPVTPDVALKAAEYECLGTELADALIAATASVHNLTLVTRNTRDFESLGIPLLNPWAATPT